MSIILIVLVLPTFCLLIICYHSYIVTWLEIGTYYDFRIMIVLNPIFKIKAPPISEPPKQQLHT